MNRKKINNTKRTNLTTKIFEDKSFVFESDIFNIKSYCRNCFHSFTTFLIYFRNKKNKNDEQKYHKQRKKTNRYKMVVFPASSSPNIPTLSISVEDAQPITFLSSEKEKKTKLDFEQSRPKQRFLWKSFSFFHKGDTFGGQAPFVRSRNRFSC